MRSSSTTRASRRAYSGPGSTCTWAWRAPTLASMRSRASCRGFPSCSLLRELALLRRRGDGDDVEPRRGPRPVAFERRAAYPLSYAEWEEFVERFERLGMAADYTCSGGTFAHIRDSGRSRSACRTSRPRSSERRGSSPCSSSFAARCSTSPSVSTTRLPAGPTSRTAGPPRASALPRSSSTPTVSTQRRRGELAAELAYEKLDTSSTESERQLEVGRSSGLNAVCADLVERTLG